MAGAMDDALQLVGQGLNQKSPTPVGTPQPDVAPTPITHDRKMAQASVPPSAPSQSPVDDALNAIGQPPAQPQAQQMPEPNPHEGPSGLSPDEALPVSPLSLMDRARMGWVRTPANQQKILEQTFGAGNVSTIQHTADESSFVVKNADGRWYQADPNFSWHSLEGSLQDTPKDIAQFAGEFGVRSAGAMIGAGIGASMGAPAGPVGAAVGAVGGAGMGAMGGEGLDMATRLLMDKRIAGTDIVPDNAPDTLRQLAASFLWGAEQEVGGQLINKGIGKAIGAGAKSAMQEGLNGQSIQLMNPDHTIESFAKSLNDKAETPTGKYMLMKLLGTISGKGEDWARVRVNAPLEMVPFDKLAWEDAKNGTATLLESQKADVGQFVKEAYARKNAVLGKAYDQVDEAAKNLKFDMNRSSFAQDGKMELQNASDAPLLKLQNALKDDGYIRNGKVIDYRTNNSVERSLSSSEKKVLGYLNVQMKNLSAASENGGISSQEVKNLQGSLDKFLYESELVQDPNLRRIIGDFRSGIKNNFVKTLGEKSPDMAKQWSEANAKYGPVKDLLEHLAPMSEGNKLDAFIKKVVKNDGKFDSEVMTSISELLGTRDPTKRILQKEVAKNSTDMWGGTKIAGIPVGSPYLTSRAINLGAKATALPADTLKQAADAVPYFNKGLNWFKSLPPALQKQMLDSPDMVQNFSRTLARGAVAQQDQAKQLLDQAGVNSSSNQGGQ